MCRSRPNRTMDEFDASTAQSDDWPESDRPYELSEWGSRHQGGNVSQQALDAAHDLAGTSAVVEELAHDLGYHDSRLMMEQTEIVVLPGGTYIYLTTDIDGYWVAWSTMQHFVIQRFKSRSAALKALQEDADVLFLES